MRIVVTGCAGFIGSSLVDRLLDLQHEVVGIDNFSTGLREFLLGANHSKRFTFVEDDISTLSDWSSFFRGADMVFHLAANADVRFGTQHPRKDLEQNTIATFNVLEAMRQNGVKRIAFSSTGSVYGEAVVVPTPENGPMPIQTSLYGASKMAGEGLITAYCEGFGFEALIFRFVSILGDRYTHGHIFDFYRKLKANPNELDVLGNGRQRKSYLHVDDCINAMLLAVEKVHGKVNIFNLGVDGSCELRESIAWICEELGLNPKLIYQGGERGWIGDNPLIYLDTSKIRALGWKPRLSIQQGVISTVRFLKTNEWVLGARG